METLSDPIDSTTHLEYNSNCKKYYTNNRNEVSAMRSKNAEYFKLIEDFINEYTDEHGRSPTNQEMADGTGLSTATVSRYLSYMREHGMLDYQGHRNIQTKKLKKISTSSVEVPLLGRVACGVPKFAEENIEEYVRLPVSLFGRGDFYLLRADGDSMIEAGIDDGDLVLIRQQDTAEPGQIIVALVGDEFETGDEATLKRYYPEPEKRRVRLHPENPALKDIFVKSCSIQGIAVKVLKDLK